MRFGSFRAAVRSQSSTLRLGALLALVLAGSTEASAEARLVRAGALAGDEAGATVALDGTTAAVGVPGQDGATAADAGAVVVYEFDGTSWSESQTLTANDAAAGDDFGRAVALDGTFLAVGAPSADAGGSDSGAVYVFQFDGTSWQQIQKLVGSDTAAGDAFGAHVALRGDLLAVGAPARDVVAADAGAVYVFGFDGLAWSEQQRVVAPDATGGDAFGTGVAVDGDALLVGAANDDQSGVDSGSAYVFRFAVGAWSFQSKLAANDGASSDHFGESVALLGSRAAVAAPDHAGSGAVYVYAFAGSAWPLEEKVVAAGGLAGDRFGASVALATDRLAVGAPGAGAGAASLFLWDGASWGAGLAHVASDGAVGDGLGAAVDLTQTLLLAGSPGDDAGVAAAGAGSAVVFDLPVCGNGSLEFGEQCDDGGTAGGDCCSSLCEIEDLDADTFLCTVDCDDGDGSVFPGAPELCDGLDNDCDLALPASESDLDVDGVVACTLDPGGWDGDPGVSAGDDCNDGDASVFPGAAELCDGQDNDCNLLLPASESDLDVDGYAACSFDAGGWDGAPGVLGGDDCNDANATIFPGAAELCDGLDNDCNLVLDPAEADLDSDLWIVCAVDAGGWDGGVIPLGSGDCDDLDASVYPGAPELCDGLDNNCDLALPAVESDVDLDGYAACTFDAGGWDGNPAIVGGGDCQDGDVTVFPGAAELCDGQDNSCDGVLLSAESDPDSDGFVSCAIDAGGWDGALPAPAEGDCNDADGTVFPGATELCDGQDNDCDTLLTLAEADVDADGWIVCAIDTGGWDGATPPDGTGDCNDGDASVFPTSAELCDGLDNDCDGALPPAESDVDGDTWVACSIDPGGWDGALPPTGGNDCDDSDPLSFPLAAELCDGLDNDCDGALPPAESDVDGDTWVACTIDAGGWQGAVPPTGGGDCNDADTTVRPGASELCDGQDNDCNGALLASEADPDGDLWILCALDAGGWDGPQAPLGSPDCNDADASVYPGAPELCDGLDNDCDAALSPTEVDGDADAWVLCTLDIGGWDGPGSLLGGSDCNDADASVFPGAAELCDGLDNDCDSALSAAESDVDSDAYVACTTDAGGWDGAVAPAGDGDCNDGDASVFPSAPELCDGLDNDCNGAVPAAEGDGDGDGYVACATDAGGWDGVPAPAGGGDCNDADISAFPGAAELCDGQDNDCDGALLADESDPDGDRYVVCSPDVGGWDGPIPPLGSGDCNPADASVFPGAAELCDGQDNDCNTVLSATEVDADGDAYVVCDIDGGGWDGTPTPAGGGDCNDSDVAINPGATEICDGIDNNCDGLADEGGAAPGTWFVDADLDGFGDPATAVVSCSQPAGLVGQGGDCNDGDPVISPAATELCNGRDDNCDGGVSGVEFDLDGDGYVICQPAPGGWLGANPPTGGGDCNDTLAEIFPGAPEICDEADNDCNGSVDDGLSAVCLVAEQSRDKQRCINDLNKRTSLVAKDQGRVGERCLKDAAALRIARLGNLGQTQTAQACLTNDVNFKLARRMSQLVADDQNRCLALAGGLPDWAYTGAAISGSTAQVGTLSLTSDLFGADLDAAVVLNQDVPAESRCQREVLKRTLRLHDDLWKQALRAKKRALNGRARLTQAEQVPVRTVFELADEVGAQIVSDPQQRLVRSVTKLRDKLALRCEQTQLASPPAALFPGSCSSVTDWQELANCAVERARCRFCQGLATADGMPLACDVLDDAQVNGSCAVP